MATRHELIEKRRKDLLKKGYPPGIIGLAIGWAVGSAEGMATYVRKSLPPEDPAEDLDTLADQFLPQYLKDAEKWIRAFGHEPKQGD